MHVLPCLCYFWQLSHHSLCCTSKHTPLISYSSFLYSSPLFSLPHCHPLSLFLALCHYLALILKGPVAVSDCRAPQINGGKWDCIKWPETKNTNPSCWIWPIESCLLTFSEISLLVPHNCIRYMIHILYFNLLSFNIFELIQTSLPTEEISLRALLILIFLKLYRY